jgi:hypothetical protein
MEERFKATLQVNNEYVELNTFVEEFLARIVVGAASSLKGVGGVQNLELYLERGDISLIVNGEDISLTPFPNDIIAKTLIGLVSALKGVNKVESLKVSAKVL